MKKKHKITGLLCAYQGWHEICLYINKVVDLVSICFGGFIMKRNVFCALLALCAVTLVSAQGRERWGMGYPGMGTQPAAPEKVTVTGNLTIAQGMLAVKSSDITYLASGLQRFVGFIDSLKDGARVTLEGYALANPNDTKTKFLRTTKLTINGKDYELAPPVDSAAPMMPPPHGGKRR
jgi:hypothetical protein